MADNHVCSFCNEDLKGKQHIKIVFENWPVEEEVTYQRKGKKIKEPRKETKEIITAIGMECIGNPDRWKQFDIDPAKVGDFFEDLRFVGKNPTLAIAIRGDEVWCTTQDCPHRDHRYCSHLGFGGSIVSGMERAFCSVGHPGQHYFQEPPLPFKYRIMRLRDFIRALNPVTIWRCLPKIREPMGFILFLWAVITYATTPIWYVLTLIQRIKWELGLVIKKESEK